MKLGSTRSCSAHSLKKTAGRLLPIAYNAGHITSPSVSYKATPIRTIDHLKWFLTRCLVRRPDATLWGSLLQGHQFK